MGNKIQKTLSATLYAILLAVLVGAVIMILPVYRKYGNMQDKVSQLEQENRKLKAEYQDMLKEVDELEHQSFAVEKIGREKYKLCREHEQILIYE